MKKLRSSLVTLLAALGFAWAEELRPFEPGHEAEVDWLPTKKHARVYLPKDYNDQRAWPLIVFYHGTGGSPTTGMMRHYTREKGFIVVGMAYGSDPMFFGAENISTETRHIALIRERLGQVVKLDGRVYIGGFSLGGWTSDLITRRGVPGLAGSLIMAAGKHPGDLDAVVKPKELAPQPQASGPVYIGLGQYDGNFVYALRAVELYRKRNQLVTFDEFLGRGHESPRETELLYQWLTIESLNDPKKRAAEAARWFDGKWADSEKIEAPLTRYLYLKHMSGAPFARYLDSSRRAQLLGTIHKASGSPDFAAEFKIRDGYFTLLNREKDSVRPGELIPLMQEYHRLYLSKQASHYGQRAGLDVLRLRQNIRLQKSSSQGGGEPDLAIPETAVPEDKLKGDFQALGKRFNTWMPKD